MAIGKPKPKQPKACPIQMALFALEPTANPLDLEMGSYDPSPTALDLGDGKKAGACPNHRRICAECGRPLRKGAS